MPGLPGVVGVGGLVLRHVDRDKTVQVAGDPVALRKALTDNGWKPEEASFIWGNPAWGEITVELLAYTEGGDKPGSPVWIKDGANAKIVKACATLKRLEPTHGLLEPCRHPSIAAFQVYRFTQLGLLLAKVVAIGQWISGHLGRKAFARAGNALAAKRAA